MSAASTKSREDQAFRYAEVRQELPALAMPDMSELTPEERRSLRGLVMYERIEPPTPEEMAAADASSKPESTPDAKAAEAAADKQPAVDKWSEAGKRAHQARRK